MKPPITYFGGKTRIADQIAALLPPHEHYVERPRQRHGPDEIPRLRWERIVSPSLRTWAVPSRPAEASADGMPLTLFEASGGAP